MCAYLGGRCAHARVCACTRLCACVCARAYVRASEASEQACVRVCLYVCVCPEKQAGPVGTPLLPEKDQDWTPTVVPGRHDKEHERVVNKVFGVPPAEYAKLQTAFNHVDFDNVCASSPRPHSCKSGSQ